MNTKQKLISLLAIGATVLGGNRLAAQDEAAPTDEVRVFVSSDATAPTDVRHASHVVVNYTSDSDEPAEPYAFLGVETARASSTLREQLGLPRGIGLVVQRVVKDTAAAEVLQKHDILTKLDDQLLVSSDQLGVLVRANDPGAEVTLTFLRGGKEQTAVVKLGERKPRSARVLEFHGPDMEFGELHELRGKMGELKEKLKDLHGNISTEEINRMMESLRLEKEDAKTQGFRWQQDGDGAVVRMLNVARGNVVFSDDDGVVELMSGEGEKHLLVKDADGNVLFEGPVDTEEERAELSDAVKARLKKVEDIRMIEPPSGADIERSELRVLDGGEESAAVRFDPADRIVADSETAENVM